MQNKSVERLINNIFTSVMSMKYNIKKMSRKINIDYCLKWMRLIQE